MASHINKFILPLSVALNTAGSTYLSPRKYRITKATNDGTPFLIKFDLVNMIGKSHQYTSTSLWLSLFTALPVCAKELLKIARLLLLII